MNTRLLLPLATVLLLSTAALPATSALASDRYTIHMWNDGSDHYEVTNSAGTVVTGTFGCGGVIASPTGSGVEVRCTPGATSCADPSVTATANAVTIMGIPIIFPLFPPTAQVNGNCQNSSGPSPAVGSCTATYGHPCSGSASGTITGTITSFCHVIPGGINVRWDATCSFTMS